MTKHPKKVVAPEEEANSGGRRSPLVKTQKGSAVPSTSENSCLNRPESVSSTRSFSDGSTRGNVHHKNKAGKGAAKALQHDVTMSNVTRVYLRSRDLEFPDADSLARFNAWVERHERELDPAEQRVCMQCGHVGFQLCAHSIRAVAVLQADPDPVIVPDRLRHFTWRFQPIKALREGFSWPRFDTHSMSDANLHGFSNNMLSDDLIVPALFSYLTMNMQTSYVVNGKDDRELRLAHVHRLAQKWIIARDRELDIEDDHHFSVRVRFTIQRATDNMQNTMLYGYRSPARNFGLAWLPGSRVSQILLVVVALLAILYLPLVVGLVLRLMQLLYLIVSAGISCLSFMAVSVPDLSAKIIVSATTPPRGNVCAFRCAGIESTSHWWAPGANAYAETRCCDFTDWVMAGLREVRSQFSATSTETWETILASRDAKCQVLQLERSWIQAVWAGRALHDKLVGGQVSPWQLLRLWGYQIWVVLQLSVYRC